MVMYLNGSTDSTISFEDEPHISENAIVRAALILVYSFIFIICFFGNLAVILVTLLRWKRQSVSKFCLANMAVANFSVSVFCILQRLTLFLVHTWIFGEFMCKMYHFITNMCHAASILMVVVISIERYLVLLHPLRCRQFLITRTLMVTILAVWISSAVISLPHLFYFGLTRVQLNESGDFGHVCVPIQSMYYSAAVDTIYFLIMYLIPLIVILALYFRIGLFLIRRESLGRDSDEENAIAQETFTGSRLPRSCQNQLGGLNVEEKRPVREFHSHSVPADLGSLSMQSDATTSSQGLRGQILPQRQENLKICLNMQEPRKGRSHPAHLLHLESIKDTGLQWNGSPRRCSAEQDTEVLEMNLIRPHLNQEETVGVGKRSYEVKGYVRGGFLGRRTALAINPEAQRILYRYKRLRLSHARCKQRQRVVRILIYIVATFALLNLPHYLHKLCVHFLPSYDMNSEANNLIAPLTFALMYANCAANPILYAFMSKSFRASLRELFCFGYRRSIVNV